MVRIEASGVCGTDYEGYHGDYYLPFPVIQGHEPLGVIEAIGPEARRRWGVDVGDRVAVRSRYRCGKCQACWDDKGDPCPNGGGFGSTSLEKPPGLWGGHAEFMYLAPGTVVHPIDGSLPPEVAVMFNPLGAGFAWAVEATGLESGPVHSHSGLWTEGNMLGHSRKGGRSVLRGGYGLGDGTNTSWPWRGSSGLT